MTLLVCTGINKFGVNAIEALLLKAGATKEQNNEKVEVKQADLSEIKQLKKSPSTYIIQIIPHPIDFVVNQLLEKGSEHHTYDYWAKVWQKEAQSMYERSKKHRNVLCFAISDVCINNQLFIEAINKVTNCTLSIDSAVNVIEQPDYFDSLAHSARLDVQTDNIYQELMLKIPLLGSLSQAQTIEEVYIENFLEHLSYLPSLPKNTPLFPNRIDGNELEILFSSCEQQKQLLNNKIEQLKKKSKQSLEVLESELKQNAQLIEQAQKEKQTLAEQIIKQQQEFEQELVKYQSEARDNVKLLTQSKSEHELALLQIYQLQEELDQAVNNQQVLAAINEKAEKQVEQQEQSKKELNQKLADAKAEANSNAELLAQSKSEHELALLQIHQLQEELEQTFLNLKASSAANEKAEKQLKQKEQSKEELNQKLAEAKAEANSNAELLTQSKSEQELALLQIHQLQEELEQTFISLKASTEANGKTEKQLKQQEQSKKELNQKLAEANGNAELLAQSKSEQELALLQIHQLQEELEQTVSNQHASAATNEEDGKQIKLLEQENNQLNQKLADAKAEANSNTELLAQSNAEQELALLQIHQLQEELEHYYVQWLEEKQHSPALTKVNLFELGNCTNAARAESLSLLNVYVQEHYQHVEFSINNLYMVDGRKIDTVRAKLVNNSGALGIEIRQADNNSKVISQWPENSEDEFGRFLLFFAEPTNEQKVAQEQTQYSMNTTDRLLVLSIINVLPKLMLTNVAYKNICSAAQLKQFKEMAISLSEQVNQLPLWTTFDDVTLKEEYQAADYEHLWLNFENLMVGNQLYPQYQLKVAATPVNEQKYFTDHISLEFRDLGNGQLPLQAWPPETEDEHGSILLSTVKLNEKRFAIEGAEVLTAGDKLLLEQLYSNLLSIFTKLSYGGAELTHRDWEQWQQAAEQIHGAYIKSQQTSVLKRLINKITS